MGYVKIRQFGTITEIYEYEKNLPINRKKRLYVAKDAGGTAHRKYTQRNPANIRRARSAFQRIVRSNLIGDANPSLLTLTMLQVLPLKASSECFRRFVDGLRARYGSGFRYIAVPEFQKRGAVHFHVLLWGLNHLCEKERTTRHFARLWALGFVDCTLTDGSPKLAGYLGKYLSKCMSDLRLRGQKAYYSSRNVMRPVQYGSKTLPSYYPHLIPNYAPKFIHEFDTEWLGRCIYKQYDSSHETNSDGDTHGSRER